MPVFSSISHVTQLLANHHRIQQLNQPLTSAKICILISTVLLFGSNKVVIINGRFMRVYLQLLFNEYEFYMNMSISLC